MKRGRVKLVGAIEHLDLHTNFVICEVSSGTCEELPKNNFNSSITYIL